MTARPCTCGEGEFATWHPSNCGRTRDPVTARPVGDGEGQDGLRSAMAVIHAWDDDDNGTYVDLAKRFTAWVDARARERAAEELRAAAGNAALGQDAVLMLQLRADSLAADDRTGQR